MSQDPIPSRRTTAASDTFLSICSSTTSSNTSVVYAPPEPYAVDLNQQDHQDVYDIGINDIRGCQSCLKFAKKIDAPL
jgi:hypothetical protein